MSLDIPLPIGYCYDSEGRTIMDEDEQVRSIVSLLFKVFQETGSAYKTTRYFTKNDIKFPTRIHEKIWQGKLVWGNLIFTRALGMLKNPSYAGVYVFGKYKKNKCFSSDGGGNIEYKSIKLPMDDWKFVIKEHHEAYISWEEYMSNQDKLRNNRTNIEKNNLISGPAREGLALLQGLLICGHCGGRMIMRYCGNGGMYPRYICHGTAITKDRCYVKYCLSIHSKLIDQPIIERVLKVIEPSQINIAIKAFEEIEQRKQSIEKPH